MQFGLTGMRPSTDIGNFTQNVSSFKALTQRFRQENVMTAPTFKEPTNIYRLTQVDHDGHKESKLIRKTLSAPSLDFEFPANRLTSEQADQQGLGKIEQKETLLEDNKGHQPHKYYNFPIRGKRKTDKKLIHKLEEDSDNITVSPSVPKIEEAASSVVLPDPKPINVIHARDTNSSVSSARNGRYVYNIEVK
mmetsp:Transcript_19500/g.22693  ORF Transcript_19500/g.22693 Transcript_19500/m.22693 type:complete len:192 (-) Transcript_19500:210-785(-)